MKKISNAVYNEADQGELTSLLIDNQNEIIDWINKQSEARSKKESERCPYCNSSDISKLETDWFCMLVESIEITIKHKGGERG